MGARHRMHASGSTGSRATDPSVTGPAHCLPSIYRLSRGMPCLVRTHERSWQALAKILHGERGFRDVEQVLHRHPTLVRTALWL